MNTTALHRMLDRAPRCRFCGETTEKGTVSWQNENGNAGRPMYKCTKCDEFACFGDTRGIHKGNPVCFCAGKMPSQAQVSGHKEGQWNSRIAHYRCASGECDFWECMIDDDGWVVTLPEGPLGAKDLKSMGL